MTNRKVAVWVMASTLAAGLVACRVPQPTPPPTLAAVATVPSTEPSPTEALPTVVPDEEPTSEPTAPPTPTDAPTPEPTPEPTAEPPSLPPGVFYDLGEAIIIQDRFPEDSRFRNMPVRLNGVMAVPEGGDATGPHPVVLILHGTHPGCPENDAGVDVWPCDPDDERPNYAGFEYLVRELAARGYVALSININGENTFGFGEPIPGERLAQIVHLHLSALAEAAAGGENNFGVPLAGVADMRRLAFVGHSRGGEMANWLAGDFSGGPGLGSPYAFANHGYGPVHGVVLVAPAVAIIGADESGVPVATVNSMCDGDVIDQSGQRFFEEVRLSEGDAPNAPALSVFLERANHNGFNTTLGPDMITPTGRADCDPLLEPERQQQFLVDFAADFLTTLFDPSPATRLEAAARLGMDPAAPAPAEVLGLPARVAALPPAADRLALFVPAAEVELTTHRLDGAVTAEGITALFCPDGYIVPEVNAGQDPCRRPTVTVPGYPAMAVVSWETPGGAWRFVLPEGARDLSHFTSLTLRAAVDPLSPLNKPGAPQQFTVRLTDGAGNTTAVPVGPNEPALQFPVGDTEPDELFDELFLGRAPLSAVRVPLDAFDGIDLADVSEIALVFDQTESGTLFLADLELARRPLTIGAYSTLLENADGANDALSGVARFNGFSTCTGAFVTPAGAPAGAPAYLITNGHCAQEWDANRVFIDQPAGEGWSATFNYFIDTPEARVTVPVTRVAYSTMKGRDVAFVELGATVGELAEQGITPLSLAGTRPDGTFELRVIGAPVTGVPPEIAFLREERCRAGGRVDLFEFIWRFNDALPNICRDIYGGSSGSPTFAGDGTEIVGLINTTNIGGLTPCALGSPCEVQPGGTVWLPDTSYATPVDGLAACFDATGTFDPAAGGCPLDDGRQLLITGYPTQGTRNPISNPDGTMTTATWNATLSGDLPYYRTKIGRAGAVDCRVDEGYGPPVTLADASLIDDPLPVEEGSYLLCVLAGESATPDETWQPAAWATAARVEIDNTPPTLTPQLAINGDPATGLLVEPVFAVPELSDFLVLVGPAETTDCADRDAFVRYRRIPFPIPPDQLPARVCVIGIDMPGNEGAVYEVVIGE